MNVQSVQVGQEGTGGKRASKDNAQEQDNDRPNIGTSARNYAHEWLRLAAMVKNRITGNRERWIAKDACNLCNLVTLRNEVVWLYLGCIVTIDMMQRR